MCSDKKREANRRNSQKSTGPRTEDGKARSRRNSLKHGLTGEGTVLPPDETQLFQERMHDWTDEDRPEGPMEAYVLGCAVLASVRVDRCAKLDLADVAERRKATTRNWEQLQRRRAKSAAKLLEEDPARAVERLTATATGCNWLIDEWDQLLESLNSEGGWNHEQAAHALRIMGLAPEVEGDEFAQMMRRNYLGSCAEIDADEVDAVCGISTADLEPEARLNAIEAALPDAASARATLQKLIDDEVEFLETRRDDLWHNQDGPKLAAAIALESFDPSPVGSLRRRYEMSSSLDFHRSLNQLARRRIEARRAKRLEEKSGKEPAWWSKARPQPTSSPIPSPYEAPEDEAPAESWPDESQFVEPEAPPPNEATESPSKVNSKSTSVDQTDVTNAGQDEIRSVPGATEAGVEPRREEPLQAGPSDWPTKGPPQAPDMPRH
jgi:hypothetical protein